MHTKTDAGKALATELASFSDQLVCKRKYLYKFTLLDYYWYPFFSASIRDLLESKNQAVWVCFEHLGRIEHSLCIALF